VRLLFDGLLIGVCVRGVGTGCGFVVVAIVGCQGIALGIDIGEFLRV
jgi:hypothetical protein